MKKLFKKLALMVVALLTFSVGSNYTVKEVKAADTETYSYTLAKGDFTSNTTKTFNGVDWTLSGDGGYWGWDSNSSKGIQFGSSSKPYKNMTLKSGNFMNVTQVKINTSGAKSINATFTVSVGGDAIGTSTKLTKSATEYTFDVPNNENLSGQVEFSYTQTSSKAIYIKSFSVTYAVGVTSSNKDLIEVELTTASLGMDYSLTYDGVETDEFVKVTDVASLSFGDSIIIVADEYDYALSDVQNSNNRGQAEITKVENKVGGLNNHQIITLCEGAVEGTFALSVDEGKYLYAASNSSNYLKTTDTLNENASWIIAIEDGKTSIVAQGSNTRNHIKYNTDSQLFSCYSETSTQLDVSVYKMTGNSISIGGLVDSNFDNISILFGAQVDASLFDEYDVVKAGVMFSAGDALDDETAVKMDVETLIETDGVYSVGAVLEIFADGEVVTDLTKARLSQNITAAVYFEIDDETAILVSKTVSISSMVSTYITDYSENETVSSHMAGLEALRDYIAA